MDPRLLTFLVPGVPPMPPMHRLACWQWGAEDAPRTVVCVHGLTRNGRDFDFLARALAAAGFRVLCPDMPGRGESDRLPEPTTYNYATYVGDMQYLLLSLGITQVDWIGTSMGGIIGMMLAGSTPGLLRSLTLNDVGCLVPAAGLKRILGYAGVKMRFASRAEAEASLRETLKPFGARTEAEWRQLFNTTLETAPDGSTRTRYDPNIMSSFDRNAIQDVNLWPLWEAVKLLPVLLIRGNESDILTKDAALMMEQTHPRLTLHEVDGAGHAPALLADAQIAFIREWLKAV